MTAFRLLLALLLIGSVLMTFLAAIATAVGMALGREPLLAGQFTAVFLLFAFGLAMWIACEWD